MVLRWSGSESEAPSVAMGEGDGGDGRLVGRLVHGAPPAAAGVGGVGVGGIGCSAPAT